jgi:hypothetical protein
VGLTVTFSQNLHYRKKKEGIRYQENGKHKGMLKSLYKIAVMIMITIDGCSNWFYVSNWLSCGVHIFCQTSLVVLKGYVLDGMNIWSKLPFITLVCLIQSLCVGQLCLTKTKYLRWSTNKEERYILAYGFRHFSSWFLSPIAFGPAERQHIMTGWQKTELFSSWRPGSEREERRKQHSYILFKSTHPRS